MGVNLKIDGIDDLMSDLRRMGDLLGADSPVVEDALKAGAEPICAQMKKNATVDPRIRSGNLYRSISVSEVKYRRHYSGKSINIGARYTGKKDEKAPHAHLVEFGHNGPRPESMPTPAHPFMRPAFDAKKDEAYQIMRDKLSSELNKLL